MKICFVGLGSIGKRHLKNLIKVCEEKKLRVEIDVLRGTSNQIASEITPFINREYYNVGALSNDYDIIFITNLTHMHYDSIINFSNKTSHMFIEKPIFHTTNLEYPEYAFLPNKIYYVASPMKFSPVIEYLRSEPFLGEVFAARAICSSYLPDWRKNNDYRNSYSAKKSEGGGADLDLIHEWDYIRYLFGDPCEIIKMSGKYSKLEINSDDLAVYLAKYKNKIIEIHLDYFGRQIERKLVLYLDRDTVTADFINNTVEYGSLGRKFRLPVEDMYIKEMRYFLNLVLSGGVNLNPPSSAYMTLKCALGDI